MHRIIEIIHIIIYAVDSQRILNQVIGSDRQEIQLAGKHVCTDGRGGYFYHAANWQLLIKIDVLFHQLTFYIYEQALQLLQLIQIGNHGNHHPHLTKRRSTVNCSELGLKQRKIV